MDIDLDKIQECVRNLKPTDSIRHEWVTDTISRDSRMIQVPEIPEDERIESMCLRYDHAHGIKQWRLNSDNKGSLVREETDEEFSQRQKNNRRAMRQLYEEATGQGFFKKGSQFFAEN